MHDLIENLIDWLSNVIGRQIERPHLAIALLVLFLLGMAVGMWSYGEWSSGEFVLVISVFLVGQLFGLMVVGISRLSPRDALQQLGTALSDSLPPKIDNLVSPSAETIFKLVAQMNTTAKNVEGIKTHLEESSLKLKSVVAEFDSLVSAAKRIRSAADVYKDSIEKSAKEQDRRVASVVKVLERGSESAVNALKGAEIAWEQNGPVLGKALEKALSYDNVLKGLQQRIDRTMVASILEAARELGKMDEDTLLSRVLSLQEFVYLSREAVASAQQMRTESEDSLAMLRRALNDIRAAIDRISGYSFGDSNT